MAVPAGGDDHRLDVPAVGHGAVVGGDSRDGESPRQRFDLGGSWFGADRLSLSASLRRDVRDSTATPRDIRQDRRDLRQDRQERRQDARQERRNVRDLRQDRRDLRQDRKAAGDSTKRPQ